MTLDTIIDDVIRREGGFSHLAADRGGATKYGITQTTLAAWRGCAVSVADVQQLSVEEARTIYHDLYAARPRILDLPPAIWPVMVDFAVNSGPPLAIRALQEILHVTPDGVVGPRTIAAAAAAVSDSPAAVINAITRWRIMMLARLVRRHPAQLIFLSGWLLRCISFITP